MTLISCQSLPPTSRTEATPTSAPSEWVNVRRSQPMMGTFVVISAWGQDRQALHQVISQAFQEIHRIDSLLSLHREESDLNALNEHGYDADYSVSPELFEVVALAQNIAQRTDGAFDVTIRPLANLWGFIWKEYRFPTEAELEKVLPKVNWRNIRLNAKNQTIRFLNQDTSIDLGGIGKGYAVDRAVQILEDHGVRRAMVRAGGDVRATAPPPGEDHWLIQIEDPNKQGRRTSLPLVNQALSTSGNYENYFEVDGRRYSHILDPRTGLPVFGVAACSLIAPTCAESDAWATACFVLGPSQSIAQWGDQFGMMFSIPPRSPTNQWDIRKSRLFP